MNKKKVLFWESFNDLNKFTLYFSVASCIFFKHLLIVHLQTHFDSRFSKDGLIHSYSLSSSRVPGSARMQFYQASKGNHVSTEMAFAEASLNSSTYIRYGCSE